MRAQGQEAGVVKVVIDAIGHQETRGEVTKVVIVNVLDIGAVALPAPMQIAQRFLLPVFAGTVRYFGAVFATCLGQFNQLDGWIRKRIRCVRYKRIWRTDNRRLLNRRIQRIGFVTCREAYLSGR